MSLAEVAALDEWEVNTWAAYRAREGFPADRGQWSALSGAAYVGACFGGKARPADLAPKFGRPSRARQASAADVAAVKAWFDSVGR